MTSSGLNSGARLRYAVGRGAAVVGLLAVAACSGSGQPSSGDASPDDPGSDTPTQSEPSETPTAPETTAPTEPEPTEPEPTEPEPTQPEPEVEPLRFDPDAAMASVRHLAGRIGPREGSSADFRRAADWVQGRFEGLGYQVSRQRVPVPAGDSWGVPVPAGTSYNVLADPAGFDPRRPHVVIGAHLDTVPQAPGAEDNASGVAVVLELARLSAERAPGLPVRFIAFGAEEPRGEGDALHHFGSQRYVALMTGREQRALAGMLSLDRVGVRGPYLPICSGPGGDTGVRDVLVAQAERLGHRVEVCDDNTTSDHWSFTKADLPSARIGSVPFAGYHTPDDVPSVIDRRQVGRVGRTAWAWVQTL